MLCRFKAFCTALLLLILTTCAEQRQGGRSHHESVTAQISSPARGELREEEPSAPPTPRAEEIPVSPRVYGVFIGISDYRGQTHDLQYCGADAERMARSFHSTGLANTDDVISLTDREATYIAVSVAFNTLARRVRDQDLFVFFFDGHGNRREIELYDGALGQADVSGLLSQVPRGRKLILFDSCEAGGFAHVAETRRTVGLFAARENEAAEIAPRFQAGGYLAYYAWQHLLHRSTGPVRGSDLLQIIESSYVACGLRRQHVVLAGDGQMLLW